MTSAMKQNVLITGGSGFLGTHMGRRLSENYSIVLGDRINEGGRLGKTPAACTAITLDVTNIESVRDACKKFKPSIVIHAAGTKFVDLAERHPFECVDVNVVGSENVAKVAMETDVETVIGLSTVIAAPPIRNTYGLSKAMMERMFCASDGKTNTKFVCVRYGNVAWSTGSVLAIWKQMFNDCKVIGTTGPEMRRFFLTVKEAVELVLTAITRVDRVHGKVLAREMKVAQISDLLNVWTETLGGEWVRIAGRQGEGNDEYLVGEIELAYAERLVLDKVNHYLIAFNQLSAVPLTEVVSSANAQRFSKEEMLRIIMNPPSEELVLKLSPFET